MKARGRKYHKMFKNILNFSDDYAVVHCIQNFFKVNLLQQSVTKQTCVA